MPASAELIDLCQAHLDLLRRAFGEVSSVIYLTLPVADKSEPMLVPIAQMLVSDELTDLLDPIGSHGQLPALGMADGLSSTELLPALINDGAPHSPSELERLVLPLIHQEIVLGVLVMLRSDRPWQANEEQYLQTISASLAAGCFLDRQNQWLRQRLNAKQTLQGEQSDVFHNLLHQFRNPLTAIGTFGKLMLRRLSQDDPNYTLADGIVRESQRLKDLVIDFDAAVDIGDADIAQGVPVPLLPEAASTTEKPMLPALGRSLQPLPQSLGNVLQPLITVTVAAASERHRQFWHSPLESFSEELVIVDTQALQEVIANLLDNAFKYTSPNAWVWLLGSLAKENFLGVVVGDNGPGIPLADQPRLFERHYRGVQSEGTVTGTGLGLAIAKDLITHMGGSIELISPIWSQGPTSPWIPSPLEPVLSPGHYGTVFIVWLPTH